MELRGKKVTVVGLGKSGLAAAKLLLEQGAEVSITDCADTEEIRKNIKKLLGTERENKPVVRLQIGMHTDGFIQGRDFVVTSPGVAEDSLPIQSAQECGIPIISEIELASRFCPCPIVAVTGTSGKTTVTTLIGMVLNAAGKRAVVCGNIGRPFCEAVESLTPGHIVVLEVSSFQLSRCFNFKPYIAVLLNLSSNHLDRHRDFNEYVQTKARIFSKQTENDWAVLNIDDPVVESLADRIKGCIRWFGMDINPDLEAVKTVGELFNISCAATDKTLSKFKGLPHRLEYIDTVRGIRFVNDSKSTTPASLIWAIRNIDRPIVLIAGGRDKEMDFSPIKDALCELKIQDSKPAVKHTILIGETKHRIRAVLDNIVPVQEADSLREAVSYAVNIAQEGDCILLSPACASFDMFKNYEERGDTFKKIVKALKHKTLKHEGTQD